MLALLYIVHIRVCLVLLFILLLESPKAITPRRDICKKKKEIQEDIQKKYRGVIIPWALFGYAHRYPIAIPSASQ